MDVSSIKEALEGTLNGSPLSIDSVYGVVIILVVAYLVYRGIRKVTNSIGSIIGFILLLEICHILAFDSSVGEWFPIMKDVFKYDVFTALAQLCVGTPVADFLLYTQAWLIAVLRTVGDKLMQLMRMWSEYASSAV